MRTTHLPLLFSGLGIAFGAAAVAVTAAHAYRDHRRRRSFIAALPRVMREMEEDSQAQLRRMVSGD